MQHLKEFLTRLQTFNLKIFPSKAYSTDPCIAESGIPIYSLGHEIRSNGNSTFENDLRRLIDLAALDLLMLNGKQVNLVLEELFKLKERFKIFWNYYLLHYNGHAYTKYHSNLLYANDYIFQIYLPKIFIVKNLMPSKNEILVTGSFVNQLGNSIKYREEYLDYLIHYVSSLLPTEKEQIVKLPESSSKPSNKITNNPVFKDGIAEKLFEIIKSYFSKYDQKLLLSLVKENQLPAFPILFNGTGNQLVDAYKQLYEANLIVGCNKGELEDWIGTNFEYVYRNHRKAFDANYLNAIISSNSKPCQSPILDVKKQPDGTYTIIPVVRTKKNYGSGS